MQTLKKNDVFTGTVIDYTHEGLGVIKIDGYPVFIKDVLLNEEIEFKLIKVNKKFGYGRALNILNASNNRITPPCEYYNACGGCQIQTMNYEEQLKFKQMIVEKNMNQIGKLNVVVNKTVGMDHPFYYRNKSQIPVQLSGKELKLGFFKPRSHDVVNIHHCMIQKESHNDLMESIRSLILDHQISIYDEENHTGRLRHVIIRTSNNDSEIQVVFVTNGDKSIPNAIVESLISKYENIVSIVQNINSNKTNVIFGDDTNVLYGHDYIKDTLLGNTFKIKAKSFYQINHAQTEKLYELAIEKANLKGNETILDTYCGIGTIGISAAREAKQLIGIEVVKEAVEDAIENAELNHIQNATFKLGKSEDVMKSLVKEGVHFDVVFVDPPRKGCHPEFLNALLEVQPEKIVYISCNPSTLQRDLKFMQENGYTMGDVTPVDMFSQTNHIECVVLLTRADN